MAILSDSRYSTSRFFSLAADQTTGFAGIRPRHIGPAIGVVEHVVKQGDRLDLLALHYYNDARRWWRIVDANPEAIYSHDLVMQGQEGNIILIPRAYEPGGES